MLCVGVLLGFVFLRIRRERNALPPAAMTQPSGAPAIGVGDCVGNPGSGHTQRVDCGSGAYYARVLARVDTPTQCLPPAAEAFAIPGASHPVLCLLPRAVVGGCLAASTVGPPDPVACTDPAAIGRILARRPTLGVCPAGTAHTVTAPYGLPNQRVICLARLR